MWFPLLHGLIINRDSVFFGLLINLLEIVTLGYNMVVTRFY